MPNQGDFGPRDSENHVGIDYAAKAGTPIPAASSGEVVYSGPSGGFHYAIVVKSIGQDGKVYYSTYGHVDPQDALAPGTKVSAGQEIGKVGTVHGGERSDGPHVHFGIVTQDTIDAYNKDLREHPENHRPDETAVAVRSGNSGGIGIRTGLTQLFVNPDEFRSYADGAPYNARTYVPISDGLIRRSDGLAPRSIPYLAQGQEADRLFSENPSNPAHLFPGDMNRFYADTHDPVANPLEAIANGSLRVATPDGLPGAPAASGFPRDNFTRPNLYLDATQAAQRFFGNVPPSNAQLFPMQTVPDDAINPVAPQSVPNLSTPQSNRRSAIPDGVTPASMQTASAFAPTSLSAPFDLFHIGLASANADPASLQSPDQLGGLPGMLLDYLRDN